MRPAVVLVLALLGAAVPAAALRALVREVETREATPPINSARGGAA